MNAPKVYLMLGGILALLGHSACNADAITYDCSAIAPTYANSIQSIMDNSCALGGCHSSSSRANGIDLSTYTKVAEEADKKRFRGSIEHVSGHNAMPKNRDQLNESERQQVYCWIENGKPM